MASRKPPTVHVMVTSAIKALDNPNGSSYTAIKNYIAAKYEVDFEGGDFTETIKDYLKTAVDSGKLIQASGTGARGSFKMLTGVQAANVVKATAASLNRKSSANYSCGKAISTRSTSATRSKGSSGETSRLDASHHKDELKTNKVGQSSLAMKATKRAAVANEMEQKEEARGKKQPKTNPV